MALYDIIDQNKDGLIRDLQGCIQIPSLQADDSSGYPYGEQVHRCLHYVLDAAQALGFRVHNMDEQVGWCEYVRDSINLVSPVGFSEKEGWLTFQL